MRESARLKNTARTLCRLSALLSLVLALSCGQTPLVSSVDEESIFNGKDLSGWSGDPKLWSVRDGMLVGSTEGHELKANTFLIHQGTYSDFHLSADVRLRNGNSGIQFRSQRLPLEGWVMAGYQADFSDDGPRSGWGNLYEERGRARGLMANEYEGWNAAKSHVRVGDWNRIEVRCQGSEIQLWLNGVSTILARDEAASDGRIGLQLHVGKPMQVEFRNLRVRRLSLSPRVSAVGRVIDKSEVGTHPSGKKTP